MLHEATFSWRKMGHDLSIAFQSLSEIENDNICQNGTEEEAAAVISVVPEPRFEVQRGLSSHLLAGNFSLALVTSVTLSSQEEHLQASLFSKV
jgi:hypothetical protein